MAYYYFDPIWAATTYNPEVNLHSHDAIRKNALELVEKATWAIGTDCLTVPILKGSSKQVYPSLISDGGTMLLEHVCGPCTVSWKQKGVNYMAVGPLIVIGAIPHIDIALKLYGPELFNNINNINNDLEYLEFD
jgi:hypothetical protein